MGLGASQLRAQAEATHTQGMQSPFILPSSAPRNGRRGFTAESAALISEKIPGHEMSVPVGVHI